MNREARKLTYRVELPGGLRRLREMVLYVCENSAGMERFGMTKLNKILWEADFSAFAERGVPVTGRPYQKLKAGPAPIEMPIILAEMEGERVIEVVPLEVGNQVEQRIIAKAKPNLHFFSRDDIDFVDRAIKRFWANTAGFVSRVSHGIAWKSRELLDPMPYECALLSDAKLSPRSLKRFKEIGQEQGWKSR
jgi:hypothetical protein